MSELIDSIDIRGFRGFTELAIPTFGKVNLVTGKNNAGKSSLLEAVRILVARGALDTFNSILSYREEINELVDPERELLGADFGPYRNLFTGFPDFSKGPSRFSFQAEGRLSAGSSSLSVTTAWAMRRVDTERASFSYEAAPPDLFGDLEGMPALEVISGEQRRLVPIQRARRRSMGLSAFRDTTAEAIRCIYLDPFSSRSTGQMGALWDGIALTDAEQEVVKALQLISPDIEGVSMIGSGESGLRSRTAIVRSRRFDSPVPLRTFGDGVNRLFGIIISLCSAKKGVLLIDEIENGLHHSVQVSVWKSIFRLAADLNVQVFATSHSQDCVHAFQEAATDSPQDGVLIRLTRQGDAVIPTVFKEKELEIAARNDIEVR